MSSCCREIHWTYVHADSTVPPCLQILDIKKDDWKKGEMVDMSRGKWDQLTQEEMVAASYLGFSLQTWNKCAGAIFITFNYY